MNKFKIIVPSYNSPEWIGKCLKSIENQTYKNYEVCIIDDCSDSLEHLNIINNYCCKNNWKFIKNNQRKFALYNIENGIKSICNSLDDIIVIVDGDDWLFDNNVFDKLNKYYSENDIYITYGQYISDISNETSHYFVFMPDDNIINNKEYRKKPWMFSHLRTFKYILFKNISKRHFLNKLGKYFETAYDLALMFPMIEMAGNKFKCINDIMYVHNHSNPISDCKIRRNQQMSDDFTIRNFPVYPTILK